MPAIFTLMAGGAVEAGVFAPCAKATMGANSSTGIERLRMSLFIMDRSRQGCQSREIYFRSPSHCAVLHLGNRTRSGDGAQQRRPCKSSALPTEEPRQCMLGPETMAALPALYKRTGDIAQCGDELEIQTGDTYEIPCISSRNNSDTDG
jgi:hypothetical protein